MIEVDDRYCKGCGICVWSCPKHVLEISKEVNSRGFYAPHVVDGAACTNCRQCELFCPDFAIVVVEQQEAGDG